MGAVRRGKALPDHGQRHRGPAPDLGYMYRNQELPAALARGQLRHLDNYNAVRKANVQFLSRELAKIPGVVPPYCPQECGHVYFMYNVRFDPAAAGVQCEPRKFRIAVEKALYREGVLVGQWQTMPVPAQDLVQEQARVRRHRVSLDDQRSEGDPLRLRSGSVPAGAEAL